MRQADGMPDPNPLFYPIRFYPIDAAINNRQSPQPFNPTLLIAAASPACLPASMANEMMIVISSNDNDTCSSGNSRDRSRDKSKRERKKEDEIIQKYVRVLRCTGRGGL
jgi:hypothetical protein